MSKEMREEKGSRREIVIDHRYVGPPDITQGGYISGTMAVLQNAIGRAAPSRIPV